MAPYFETVKVRGLLIEASRTSLNLAQSFADVAVTEDGIDTKEFLEASDGLVQMFGGFFLSFFDASAAVARVQAHTLRPDWPPFKRIHRRPEGPVGS